MKKDEQVLGAYPTQGSAESHLKHLSDALHLCPCLLGLHDAGKDCIYRQMDHCRGAHFDAEGPESYNIRAKEAVSSIDQRFDEDFLIIERGRSPGERALILIRKGKIFGYGYCSTDQSLTADRPEEWSQHIDQITYNPEKQRIARNYIKHNNKLERIPLGRTELILD